MRRRNLNTDFSESEQRTLARLVLNYLTEDPELIRKHMRELDHAGSMLPRRPGAQDPPPRTAIT